MMNDRNLDGTAGGRPAQPAGEGRPAAWETRVLELAQAFAYPDTPDLAANARAVVPRSARIPGLVLRPAWAAALCVVVVGFALLTVPQVRAAVVRVFQLGVVRIFITESGSAATQSPGNASLSQPHSGPESTPAQMPLTATPFIGPPPTALPGVMEAATDTPTAGESDMPAALAGLAGRTTLDEARRRAPFPVALPADLGEPDYVFVQEHAAPVVILAWNDPAAKGGVGLSLWMFLNGTAIEKFEPKTVAETTVNGGRALWTQGEHMLYMRNGNVKARRLVLGNTLIWERRDVTFRLETFLPLEEAVKVAESVR